MKLIFVATPEQAAQAAQAGTVAHLAYRVDPGRGLLRLAGRQPGPGGLLCLPLEAESNSSLPPSLLRQILAECRARRYEGVLVDLPQAVPPGITELIGQLDAALDRSGLSLYVPERFARVAPHGKVLISTALSAGSLKLRLEEALSTYGSERMAAAAELVRMDFTPPCASGRTLSAEDLDALRSRLHPSLHWSPELCARYFTYFEGGIRAHFILFDDGDTLRHKLRLAEQVGVQTAVAAWTDYRK